MGGTMMPTLTWKAVVLLIISARVLQVVGKAKRLRSEKSGHGYAENAGNMPTQLLSLKSDLFSFANVLKSG
jgi:hypothetical protein